MKFGTDRHFVWTTPPANGDTEVDEYKFHFKSCLIADSGKYFAAMRDFEEWYERAYGGTNAAARQSEDEAKKLEAVRLWNRANDYGAIIASLASVEVRSRPVYTNGDQPTPWQKADPPSEWANFEDFETSAPWPLITALADAAHTANPGLWRNQDDEEAKKNGGVSAS